MTIMLGKINIILVKNMENNKESYGTVNVGCETAQSHEINVTEFIQCAHTKIKD